MCSSDKAETQGAISNVQHKDSKQTHYSGQLFGYIKETMHLPFFKL